ncbi:MAG TPA: hypothetical protein VNZ86_05470 [Bacteroidia bacterium]|nr:hypothetical protein [Bacteroidia bacterium]
MKQLLTLLFSLLFCAAVQANPGPRTATGSANIQNKALVNAGAVRFQFNQISAAVDHKDSVLIIFDRYDRTGAGVVYQVFAADDAEGITIPQVPAGKYYVTIQCLGLHHDRLEKLVTIKSQKNEKVRIELEPSEEFSKDKVVIPAYRPDFSDLAIKAK